MSIPPVVPVPGADPVPSIGEPPPMPIREPDPDRLPDEEPVLIPMRTRTRRITPSLICARRAGGSSATACKFIRPSEVVWSRASSFGGDCHPLTGARKGSVPQTCGMVAFFVWPSH